MSTAWTPERLETAVKMWNGGHSAAAIAAKIGDVSRNAVIGKVHRHPDLFLARGDRSSARQARGAAFQSPALTAPKPKARKLPTEENPQAKVVKVPARLFGCPVPLSVPVRPSGNFRHRGLTIGEAAPVAFKKRGTFQCAWPLTDFQDESGGDMPCCGRPQRGGSSYCAEHAAISRGDA